MADGRSDRCSSPSAPGKCPSEPRRDRAAAAGRRDAGRRGTAGAGEQAEKGPRAAGGKAGWCGRRGDGTEAPQKVKSGATPCSGSPPVAPSGTEPEGRQAASGRRIRAPRPLRLHAQQPTTRVTVERGRDNGSAIKKAGGGGLASSDNTDRNGGRHVSKTHQRRTRPVCSPSDAESKMPNSEKRRAERWLPGLGWGEVSPRVHTSSLGPDVQNGTVSNARARLARLVERATPDLGVTCSSPALGTEFLKKL